MARNYTANSTINLSVNAKQASQMMSKLKKETADLERQFKAAEKAGDKVQMKNLRRQIKENERLMKLFATETAQAADVLQRLDKATPKELQKTLKTLQAQLQGMQRGTDAWNRQVEAIRRVRAEIDRTNASMRESKSWWGKIKDEISSVQNFIMAASAALVGFVAAGRKAVSEFTKMNETETDTRKFTGLTADGIRELNDSFKAMDTRTARESLNSLAQEAGRLGKNTQDAIMGYVKGADVLNVALSDLGQGATEKVAKLSNIFKIEDQYGTYDAMLKVGSVINVLSQNCTASKPYLVEFANRLAGVGAQAQLSLQNIIGFGAVLDSNAQALEASATAIGQVLTRMYQDPTKYAKVAGMDVKKFTDTLNKDANSALIMFLEHLAKAKDLSVLSPMFKDMGENGARVITALSTLAKHIDEVKEQQLNANRAFDEGTSVLNEYNLFNNTAQASLDKAQKKMKELTIELGEKLYPIMSHIYSSSSLLLRTLSHIVTFVVQNKTEIVILTSAVTAYAVTANLAAIKTKTVAAAQLLWNKAMLVSKIPAFRLMVAALTNAYQYLANGLRVSYEMQERWKKSMAAMNLTNWAGLILAVAAAAAIFAKRMHDAYKEQQRLREERLKFEKEAQDYSAKATDMYSKEISLLKRLYSAATDEAKSKDERIAAAKRLQDIYPAQFSNMTAEEIMLGKAKTAYDNLTQSIINNAKAKAAAEKVLENEKKILDLEAEIDSEREKRREASAERDRIRAYNKQVNENASNSASTVSGAIAMQAGGSEAIYEQRSTKEADKKVYAASANIREKSSQKEVLEKANNKLTERFKNNSTFNSEYLEGHSIESPESYESTELTDYTKTESDKERKKRLAAEAAEARRAAAKEKKEFKDALKQIQGSRDQAEMQAKADRMAGVDNYLEYIERMREAEENFFKQSKELYLSYNLEEDADYKALLEKKIDAEKKYNDQKIALSKEATERIAKADEREIRARYAEIANPTIADQLRLQEEILINNYTKLVQIQSLYDPASKEWADYEYQINDLIATDKLEKQKMVSAKVAEFQKEFDKLSISEKYKIEREALELLYKQKRISEEDYRRWLGALDKKEQQESSEAKGDLPGKIASGSKEASEKFNKEKARLDQALSDGLIDQEEYSRRLAKIKNDLDESLIAPLKECKSEWVSLTTSMIDAWKDVFDSIKSGGSPFETISKAVEATAAVMAAVTSQITEFTKAQAEIQIASVQKRYDREIAFAEGNAYLTKKLEKEKQDEVAKIKEDAANKEFTMQVISAIAQTASNALAAYGSAATIPVVGHVLAPIAAGIAVAQGMVQVALIKKQKEAAAASGYSEGGFTRPGAKDEPAGIVHAGEWVASQKLVNSPVARPLIDMLEHAQRTNTIASLSMEDVSRSITAPMMLAYAKPDQPAQQVQVIQAQPESNPQGDLVSSLDRLNRRLDQPFVTLNTVAGDFGSKQAQDKYNRMMRNKSRKSR